MIRSTYLGKAIRATVQDGEAAMLMGIPVPRIFLITFAGGSALVGLAACVMMPLFSVFPTVGLNFVLIAFVIVVLGGMGSIEGALLGGICIGVVQSLSSYYVAPAFGQMFFFILFLLVMLFRPDGILGQKGAANHRDQRLMSNAGSASRSVAWRSIRLPAMPRRGASRCSRSCCFVVCIALVAVAIAAEPARRYRADIPVCRSGARLEYRRRLCRTDFIWARRILRYRRLHLDDPVCSWRRHALDRAVGRGADVQPLRGAVLAVICARLKGRSSSCRRWLPPKSCGSAR